VKQARARHSRVVTASAVINPDIKKVLLLLPSWTICHTSGGGHVLNHACSAGR